jgi:hypothetical protein
MQSANLYRAGPALRPLVFVFVFTFTVRAQAARPTTRPETRPADLAALKAKLDSARADILKARADVIRRLGSSPQYKAAVAEVEAREKALAKAKASQEGVEWAETVLRSNRKRVAGMRQEALTSPDGPTLRALQAAEAARAAYEKAGGGVVSAIVPTARDTHRVVVVCDASRMMINNFALLRGELTKWISELEGTNEFNIILFGEPRMNALTPKGFLPATRDNKRKAYQLIEDVSIGGKRDPTAALEAAFQGKPQVICLLAGGDFEDNQAVVEQVRRLNRDGKVKVHAILWGAEPRVSTTAVDALCRIADASGGMFDCVSLAWLEEGLQEQRP